MAVRVPVPVCVPVPVPEAVASAHLAEHFDDADQGRLGVGPVLLGHDAEQTNDVEQSARLPCRAASDGAEPGAVR